MAIPNSLMSKKLPIGVFAGVKSAPSPARIMIDIEYSPEFSFLLGLSGFKTTPVGANANNCRLISFEIPVTPPTVKIDFGNSKDTENVARIGEVVMPKYKKATQFRWESFFPYDMGANYLNYKVRNLSFEGLSRYKDTFTKFVNDTRDAFNGLKPITASPETYVKIFKILSSTETPFTIAMTFYDGGNLPATRVTLDSFGAEPENNGDYSYEISLVEWTDIQPRLLNQDGELKMPDEVKKVKDSWIQKIINGVGECWKFCKKYYPVVSKALIWAFATYNGARNLIFDAALKMWKIKGSLQDLGGRFGILNNMFGLSKITASDVKPISNSLKKLSFTKASKQMAEFLNQNKMYRS